MTSKLFALDIGTRSVVGIILEEINERFHVKDILVKEHKERAMVDGQIHNVLYVAELIREIKDQLALVHGPLTKVSVAAAGRALKTEQASVTVAIKNRPIFTEEDIHKLELEAVQQAQQQLLQHKDDTKKNHYYCVGYSVLYYRLDGEEIGSLLDQQGDSASIEVIATFLPRVVVESLLAALKRADLEMEAMTLEPIAAINVLIPPSMRRLNVALVDIGAGTSDIAITDKGTIVAYGMVPVAGDEITEALSDHYLLDFQVAEMTKRQLQTHEEIHIQDILGFDQSFPKEDVLTALQPAISTLAQSIGQEILRLNNQQAPKAIMLVGGGSLTPGLPEELSRVLQLPTNRVAIRGIDAIQNLTRNEAIKATPELVTPIGIAIAAKKSPIQYMSVTVNEQVVRLFELKEMTVTDAFLAANIRAKQLYGKPGHGLSVTVNGHDIFIPGEHGRPAQILLNGETCSIKTFITSGDAITLIEGQDGQAPTITIADVVDTSLMKEFTLNGQIYYMQPIILLNGQPASLTTQVSDRDCIEVTVADTLEQGIQSTDQRHLLNHFKTYCIELNGKKLQLPEFSTELLVNGLPKKLHVSLQNGDNITLEIIAAPTFEQLAKHLNILLHEEINVTFQQEQVQLIRRIKSFSMQDCLVKDSEIIPNGATLKILELPNQPWIFQDVFRFSKWQMKSDFKGNFTILRNGESARFDTEIFGGDYLEIVLHSASQPL